MSILNKILKTFIGDKTKKDLSTITPLVKEINIYREKFESLSNDDLRQKTLYFKKQLEEGKKGFIQEIKKLQKEVENNSDIDIKEDIYQKIDILSDEADKASEDILNRLLPEAFAVVKETAKRFKENTSIEVTASSYDRELSQNKDYVKLKVISLYGKIHGMLQVNP